MKLIYCIYREAQEEQAKERKRDLMRRAKAAAIQEVERIQGRCLEVYLLTHNLGILLCHLIREFNEKLKFSSFCSWGCHFLKLSAVKYFKYISRQEKNFLIF